MLHVLLFTRRARGCEDGKLFYIESNAEPVLWCASDVAAGDKWLAHDWHNANMAINILLILYCTPAVSIN